MSGPGRPPAVNNLTVQRRKRAGLTQTDLAKLAGRSVQAVKLWERGQRPDLGLLLALERRETAPLFPELNSAV